MYQICRAAPLMLLAALVICTSVGCDALGKKKDTSVEPPVMALDEDQGALARAQQVPSGKGGEVELVEQTQGFRAQYRQALETLLAYYRRYGYYDKGRWAEKEIRELRNVTRYPYLGDAVAASTRHEPKESLSQANALYDEARKLHQEATSLAGMLGGGKAKLQKALDAYRRLMDEHPNSDKIDDAAFYAGEIYASDTHKEYKLALNCYQRCLNWNPNTDLPAKFRMAVLYDRRLRDRERAMALYKEVVQSSPNRANIRFAQERIRVLTDRASYEAPDAEPGARR